MKGVVGDFFKGVPKADAYMIKRVLHNWNEADSIKILKNSVAALNDKKNGRIFVVEKLIPKHLDGSPLIDFSLLSIALGSTPERTLDEFKYIASKASLELEKVIDSGAGVSLMVFKYRY